MSETLEEHVACDGYLRAEYLRRHEIPNSPPCIRDMDTIQNPLDQLDAPPCLIIGYCLLDAMDND